MESHSNQLKQTCILISKSLLHNKRIPIFWKFNIAVIGAASPWCKTATLAILSKQGPCPHHFPAVDGGNMQRQALWCKKQANFIGHF